MRLLLVFVLALLIVFGGIAFHPWLFLLLLLLLVFFV